jgi:hypothetical protein
MGRTFSFSYSLVGFSFPYSLYRHYTQHNFSRQEKNLEKNIFFACANIMPKLCVCKSLSYNDLGVRGQVHPLLFVQIGKLA